MSLLVQLFVVPFTLVLDQVNSARNAAPWRKPTKKPGLNQGFISGCRLHRPAALTASIDRSCQLEICVGRGKDFVHKG